MDTELRIKNAIENSRAVVMVGTGYSMYATQGADSASWLKLMEASIEYARTHIRSADEEWVAAATGLLTYATRANDTSSLINCASLIRTKIGESGQVALNNWMKQTVGQLSPKKQEWGEAIAKLSCPIFTTNYDTLLEQVTGLKEATWTNSRDIQGVLTGEPAIGHIHGIWSDIDSLVFTDTDYATVLESQHLQAIEKAISTTKSIIYIGYGSGLTDPNFSSLLKWQRETFPNSTVEHFRLCLQKDYAALVKEHAGDNITPVVYGQAYEDFGDYITAISPARTLATLSKEGIIQDTASIGAELLTDQLRSLTIVGEVVGDVENQPLEKIVIPPVILPVSHDEYAHSQTLDLELRHQRTSLEDLIDDSGIIIIAGEEQSGLSTGLMWLLTQAVRTRSGIAPLLVDFKQCQSGMSRPLSPQIRAQLRNLGVQADKKSPLPPYILAIDNMSPHSGKKSDRVIQEISESAADKVFVGCRQGDESELYSKFESVGVTPKIRYVGRLSKSDVILLAQLVSPVQSQQIAANAWELIKDHQLPNNPFTASLLLSILSRGDKIVANLSPTSILDQYVNLLLGRGDPFEDGRFSFDASQKVAILADIAKLFVEKRKGSLLISEVTARVEGYFEKYGWTESVQDILASFYLVRILKTQGTKVQFSQSSYLFLFAAHAAMEDSDFRKVLFDEALLMSPIVRHYAALKRTDRELIEYMDKLFVNWNTPRGNSNAFKTLDLATPPDDWTGADIDGDASESFARTGDIENIDEHLFAGDSDIDAEAFPLSLESDLPIVIRHSLVLELVSTVLRDSDRVEDMRLKNQVLRKTLLGWGNLVDLFHEDEQFIEATREIAEMAISEFKESTEKKQKYIDQIEMFLPPLIVMGGVASNLSSRKLLRSVRDMVNDSDFRADPKAAVAAALFLLDVKDASWVADVKLATEEHANTWIIRNFFLRICIQVYLNSPLTRPQQTSLVQYIADLESKHYSVKNEIARKSIASTIAKSWIQRKLNWDHNEVR